MAAPLGPLKGGLTWEQLAADDRPRRLKGGKHFEGGVRDVQQSANEAAALMGMAVRTMRDEFSRRHNYVWLQFADREVPEGAPCPICGHHELLRLHEHFARCANCRSRLLLGPPPPPEEEPARGPFHRALSRDRTRLSAFHSVELIRDEAWSTPEMERWLGRGYDQRDIPLLLLVEYPLENGVRLPDPMEEGEDLHRVRYWGLHPFQRALELEVLDGWPEPDILGRRSDPGA